MESTHWLRYCFMRLQDKGLVQGEFHLDVLEGDSQHSDSDNIPLISARDLFPGGTVPEDRLKISEALREAAEEMDDHQSNMYQIAKTDRGYLDLSTGIGTVRKPGQEGLAALNYLIIDHQLQGETFTALDLHLDLGEDCVCLEDSVKVAEGRRSKKDALLSLIVGEEAERFNKQSRSFGINLLNPQEAIDNFLKVLFSIHEGYFGARRICSG